MKKILIAGCGGAPSEGVVNSLLKSGKAEEIIGMGSEPADLFLSNTSRKYLIPYANSPLYEEELLKILDKEKPGLVHFQNDHEVFKASSIREMIMRKGTKIYMPNHDVIDTCVHKHKSYLKWQQAGIRVPRTIVIKDRKDLSLSFDQLGDKNGNIWLRSSAIGAGGMGALPTNDPGFAQSWIDYYQGWGSFVAAEMLSPDSVTWLSIWYEGELVVAQSRRRQGWVHANRTLSGVTGVTKTGITFSDQLVDTTALDAIKAIDPRPHGIYGVDMTYDLTGIPNPTEINISRFFTTILFFTEAGLNLPVIFKDIALYEEFPVLEKKINPLPDGLMWIRGMDTTPRLTTEEEMLKSFIQI